MIDAYLCIQIVAYDTWDIYEGFGSTQWLGFNDVFWYRPWTAQTLEQNQAYTDEEMREFEEHLVQQEEDLNQKAVDLQKQRQELEKQQEQLNAQKVELQQVNTGLLVLVMLVPSHRPAVLNWGNPNLSSIDRL